MTGPARAEEDAQTTLALTSVPFAWRLGMAPTGARPSSSSTKMIKALATLGNAAAEAAAAAVVLRGFVDAELAMMLILAMALRSRGRS